MKRRLAHAMRQTARALIRQSNKLDPPHAGPVYKLGTDILLGERYDLAAEARRHYAQRGVRGQ